MIQDQLYPSLPWHGLRSRQKVLRSSAQHARYFLLGLAVVSLFIGLNVFLASQTAELEIRIWNVERQCQELSYENAELAKDIALATSIDEAEEYGRTQGFASAQQLVYLSPSEVGGSLTAMHVPGANAEVASAQSEPVTHAATSRESVLERLRKLIPALSAGERVASTR
jgi:hypothetical protein